MRFLGSIFLISICLFVLQVSCNKYSYEQQKNAAHDQFTSDQLDLLYRIGKVLQEPIKTRDTAQINRSLAAYEGVLFALNLPVSMQVVIFNAPQQVIGLLGELAPDENYYTNILHQPDQLFYSKTYIKSTMPDYPMLNYGTGVLSNDNQLLGVLEIKIPKSILQDYLSAKYPDSLFINIIEIACVYFLLLILVTFAYLYMTKYKKDKQMEIAKLKAELFVRDKYSNMDSVLTRVNVLQIVQDVYERNYNNARDKDITLDFPGNEQHEISCFINPKALMQRLSDIVSNVIKQLGEHGNLHLQVNVSKEYVEFIFVDNGFYAELSDDWGQLADCVEYVHTAYSGNKIVFKIARVVKDNVVRLENYLER